MPPRSSIENLTILKSSGTSQFCLTNVLVLADKSCDTPMYMRQLVVVVLPSLVFNSILLKLLSSLPLNTARAWQGPCVNIVPLTPWTHRNSANTCHMCGPGKDYNIRLSYYTTKTTPPTLWNLVAMASLHLDFPDNSNLLVPAPCQRNSNLPSHILGTAYWFKPQNARAGYYCSIHNTSKPVEFINNLWFGLAFQNGSFFTQQANLIPPNNTLGLSYWQLSDPQHPLSQVPSSSSRTHFWYTQNSDSELSESTHTAENPDNDSLW